MNEYTEIPVKVLISEGERDALHAQVLAALSGIGDRDSGIDPEELRELLRALDAEAPGALELALVGGERAREVFAALRDHARHNEHLAPAQEALVQAACRRVLTLIEAAGDQRVEARISKDDLYPASEEEG